MSIITLWGGAQRLSVRVAVLLLSALRISLNTGKPGSLRVGRFCRFWPAGGLNVLMSPHRDPQILFLGRCGRAIQTGWTTSANDRFASLERAQGGRTPSATWGFEVAFAA